MSLKRVAELDFKDGTIKMAKIQHINLGIEAASKSFCTWKHAKGKNSATSSADSPAQNHFSPMSTHNYSVCKHNYFGVGFVKTTCWS